VRTMVRGWGRSTGSGARLAAPDGDAGWRELLAEPGARGLIARGCGSSYGDAAQNAGGVVASTLRTARITAFDRMTGIVTADAGVSLGVLLHRCVPAGWVPPVLPGTTRVTLGGAVAADVHGKNHPTSGSFSAYVREIRLLTPGRGDLRVSRDDHPDVFWATVGGLGLTGVIREVTLQLRRIETSSMVVEQQRAFDLDDVFGLLADEAPAGPHRMAWIDPYAGGARFGRGVVGVARYASREELATGGHSLGFQPHPSVSFPSRSHGRLLRPAVVRTANAARLATARWSTRRVVPMGAVLHPLDRMAGWPRLHGKRGLVQYQFVVPPDATDVVEHALRSLAAAGCTPTLATLKRLGAAGDGPLSFPRPGWTLAVDLPAGNDQLGSRLSRLDERVAAAGGRVYLAKDARLRPDLVGVMYPRLDEWRAVRDRLDPDHVMMSDLARRLHLTEPAEHRMPGAGR
jgi:decaprenylphospho-beta-D-ribofuranose 2-oxidase